VYIEGMDKIQIDHERAVGDRFIGWYNENRKKNFAYYGRPEEVPDLIYRDGTNELFIELGDAYYDRANALGRWERARGKTDAPKSWSGVNFDRALIANINAIIQDKSGKDYGPNCILVVNVDPELTTGDEMEAMLPEIVIPTSHFVEIYLTGHFGYSTPESGGYRCWKINN
jgi:hypothetical protein